MKRTLIAALALAASLPAAAQTDWSKIQVKSEQLNASTWMLTGAGGNIGVAVSADAVFVIDDQYAPLSAKIKVAIGAISDKPIRFILNTHAHGDHTGGNAFFMKEGVTILAQENVRKRMLAKPDTAAAAPVLTFSQDVDFHLNGEAVQVRHMPRAHTDGDAIVIFKGGNIVHMGDLFFNGLYPRIDVSDGGHPEGVVAAVDKVLAMVDDKTRIIPGHGPLGGKAELQAYRDMLATVTARIKAMADKPLAEVLAAKPTADFDPKWGNGFMKPAAFAEMLWKHYQK